MIDSKSQYGFVSIEGSCVGYNSAQSNLDPFESVYEDSPPHITVGYGVGLLYPFEHYLNELYKFKYSGGTITGDNIDFFERDGAADVVHISMSSDGELGRLISTLDPLGSDDITPHLTLGYVPRGSGDQYCTKLDASVQFLPHTIVVSGELDDFGNRPVVKIHMK